MALTNSQYEGITREYEQIRDKNRHILETRRKEIYQKVDGYRELEESVGSLSHNAARLVLEGDDAAPAKLHDQLKELAVKRAKLLTDAGFPADYLDPIYLCRECEDTGYVLTPEGTRQKCRCFRQKELSVRYTQSNLQDLIRRENFSTLSYEYYQGEDLQHFKAAVELSKNFVKNFNQVYRNLFFYGTVGTGKSFLSGCIANELLQAGASVIYFSAFGLFERLARYSFDAREKDTLHAFYEDLYGCDLLIIDDLGTEITNSFVTSQLFSCLNERWLRRRPVIISTNLSLEELRDRYSDRIFSRITSGFSLCKLTGPDIRIYRKRQANAPASNPQTTD